MQRIVMASDKGSIHGMKVTWAGCFQVGDAAVLHDTAPAFQALITAARASPGAFQPGQAIPLASLLSS